MTEEQEILAAILNEAVSNTGYRGGKVVHHGPENQYSESPYIDYPITVFAPDHIPNGLFNQGTDGLVLSLEMGPPGFRDLYLKQFVNRMRKEGYDLYHNPDGPGWKWTWDTDAEAYEIEDGEGIGDYVEQLPKNACDKFGGQKDDNCQSDVGIDDAIPSPGEPKGPEGRSISPLYTITPTVASQYIIINTTESENSLLEWVIIDADGNVCKKGLADKSNTYSIEIDIHDLNPGIFNVVATPNIQIGRFVKM